MNALKNEVYAIIKPDFNPNSYGFSHVYVDLRESYSSDVDDAIVKNSVPFGMFESPYDGLTLNNQYGSVGARDKDTAPYGYGLEVEMRGTSVRKAENIVKLARRLSNRIVKLMSKDPNNVTSYYFYMKNAFKAAKVKRVLVVGQNGKLTWYNDPMQAIIECDYEIQNQMKEMLK